MKRERNWITDAIWGVIDATIVIGMPLWLLSMFRDGATAWPPGLYVVPLVLWAIVVGIRAWPSFVETMPFAFAETAPAHREEDGND